MRIVVCALGIVVIAVLAGCQMHMAPMSAQAGSTMVIGFEGVGWSTIGTGGTHIQDPQRGQMRFRLTGGPSGTVDISTRGSTKVMPYPSADAARYQLPIVQGLSVVDIPDTVLPGVYEVDAFYDPAPVTVPPEADWENWNYHGTLTVLPATVVDGSATYDAIPTPHEKYSCFFGNCGWNTGNLEDAIARPELAIQLSQSVAAVELTVDYPQSTIDFLDVYGGIYPSGRPLVWSEDDDVNGIVAMRLVGTPFNTVMLVFSLDGSTPLTPGSVTISVDGAWDDDGTAIAGVTASATQVH